MKYKKSEIKRRVEEAAKILSIEDYLERRPKALSGGQRQRVAVGRAIVRKPEAFLFDEPLSNLDAKMRVQMRTEISKLHTQLETTMIYVTHDQVEAMTMGDRICVMKDGLIQQIADPITLYDKPTNLFVASFIGTPPMNLFEGDLSQEGDKLKFKEDSFELYLPTEWQEKMTDYVGKRITFGIRPEDIGSEQATDKDFPTIKAVIEVVEPMGAETYLYLNTGKHPFIARVDAHLNFKVGQEVELPLYMPKAHVFDSITENIVI